MVDSEVADGRAGMAPVEGAVATEARTVVRRAARVVAAAAGCDTQRTQRISAWPMRICYSTRACSWSTSFGKAMVAAMAAMAAAR